ncbi:hypothetical protein [Alicyclobacillus fastidiosus]|uniref:Uncharacterized protein n=1 Tax=Alicyclobacillus fastidiosus TaxID=392011 RepID=A0ABV5AFT3_9BACL|nr:hypothetical protein [Alicyclobacillus fastidiosus]WEH11665.1 hypothetical protein PYS47_10885 [Alicyclobacillus fastidiosus]
MEQSMSSGGPGIWRGWYWRFVGGTVVVLAVLEVAAYYLSKYSFITSGELGMFISAILVVQRAKEKRTLNTLLATILGFVINVIFQLTLGYAGTVHYGWGFFFEQNAIIGAIGILFSVVYARTQEWSNRRRDQMQAKRRQEAAARDEDSDVPQVRVHRVKKKRGRGRR